jgi:glycosyltransferase involved in cell wall biosynthesis
LATFVVIPTYNEADNLPTLVAELLALPLALRVLVVDDNSPDGTGRLADELAALHPGRVHVMHRPGKQGLGTAYIAGFQRALADPDTDSVLTMDADFSHHPRYIPAMVALGATRPVVIGSRYVAGGATQNAPLYRRILSRTANGFARAMLGLRAHDATAGFRLYQRAVLESIPLHAIFSSGYSFLIEMLYLVQGRRWPVGEVPITFADRRAGRSKISQTEIFKALYTVLRLSARRLRVRLTNNRAPAEPAEVSHHTP